jgi:hypothetical protein
MTPQRKTCHSTSQLGAWALAAYPGGIVDRFVKLSNGEHNVHYIGTNGPHHVFVNQECKVVGAE